MKLYSIISCIYAQKNAHKKTKRKKSFVIKEGRSIYLNKLGEAERGYGVICL
jgi:hypothetical protein